MPLRAINNQRAFNAFEFDETEWRELKLNYKDLMIKLPCCNADAIPKTSKLGTYFFSHKTQGICNSKPESIEHIFLKSLIAKAAASAGWAKTTEFSGSTSTGESWIADVFCTNGKHSVALEVQLSYITYDKLKARTEKYKSSGVRVAWLVLDSKFNEDYVVPSKEIPIFRLNPFKVEGVPTLTTYNVNITEFVFSLLKKKVNWIESDKFLEYQIEYIDDICHRCKQEVMQIVGYSIDVYGRTAMTLNHLSTILEEIHNLIPKIELQKFGLNYIQSSNTLRGKANSFRIYSNTCSHCNACQDNYYVMNHFNNINRTKTITYKTRFTTGKWSLNNK